MPITVLPGLSTKYGPESDPVGLGVTLSYNCPISSPDLQEDLPKIVKSKNPSLHRIILCYLLSWYTELECR